MRCIGTSRSQEDANRRCNFKIVVAFAAGTHDGKLSPFVPRPDLNLKLKLPLEVMDRSADEWGGCEKLDSQRKLIAIFF